MIPVTVVALLRDHNGDVDPLTLGPAAARSRTLFARVPPGDWEVEAIEVEESTGLEATNGHQNGENAAAATQSLGTVTLGPLRWTDGGRSWQLPLTRWRGVGALSSQPPAHSSPATAGVSLTFDASGFPGILRPVQPSDLRPVPILADPGTAAAAGGDGRLALTVDGLSVNARVVGVVRRFPTVPPSDAGFVVADESVLGAALDAQLPGQGQADSLWISTSDPRRLRAALQTPRLASLSASFRGEIQHTLSSAPIARAVSRVLVAGGVLAAVLAAAGLMLVILGPLRDRRIEADLEAQGFGPRALRREVLLRLTLAVILGAAPGIAIGAGLGALTVSAVQRAEGGAVTWPPLVPIVPLLGLAGWTLVTGTLVLLAARIAVSRLFREPPAHDREAAGEHANVVSPAVQ